MMTWQSAKVSAIDGSPKRADGSPIAIGDELDKAAIDGVTGGTLALDRAVGMSFRFPVAANAPPVRQRPDFSPKPPPGAVRIAADIETPAPAAQDAPVRPRRR